MDLSKLRPLNYYTDLTTEEKEAYETYLKYVVDYVPTYDQKLDEIEPSTFSDIPEGQLEIIGKWMNDYVQEIGIPFDTLESEHLKMALEYDISVRFLSKYRPSHHDPVDYGGTPETSVYVNILEFFDIDESPEKIYALYKEFKPLVTFGQYLEAAFYYLTTSEDVDSLQIYEKIREIHYAILSENMQSYRDIVDNRIHWEQMVQTWRRQEIRALGEYYDYQRRLLFNKPFPGLSKRFVPISRDLSFDVILLGDNISEVGSIYDAFIVCQPTGLIPFVRIDRTSYTTPGGRDTEYAIYSYSAGNSNKWKDFDENVTRDLSSLLNFSAQGDTLSFLIDINKNGDYSTAVLTSKELILTVPNDIKLADISDKIIKVVYETFKINVDNIREKSIQISTRLPSTYNGFSMTQYIEPTLFQFYLLSDVNLRMYINENIRHVDKQRKIRIKSTIGEFFDQEFYEISFETSDPLNINITGPNRAKAENFFNNIFSRIFQGYILRQNNILSGLMLQITGVDKNDDTNSVAGGKPKRGRKRDVVDSSKNQGMVFARTKIDTMKKLVNLSKDYSRFKCPCPKQPVVIPDDEVDAWKSMTVSIIHEDSKTTTLREREVKKFILPDGRSINLTCPRDALPFIGLVGRPKKGKISKIFSPCCWVEKQPDVDINEIVVVGTDNCDGCDEDIDNVSETESRRTKNLSEPSASQRKISKLAPSTAAANFDYTHLPVTLSRLLNYGDMKEHQNEYRLHLLNDKFQSSIITNNSLLECILLAVGNREYSRESKINLSTKEKVLLRYRRRLRQEVDAMTYTQENYDTTLSDIDAQISNPNIPLTYSRHSRGLEEFFKIHLYSFLIFPKKSSVDSDDFQIEIPRYQVSHLKTLYSERPSIMVVSFSNEPNVYSLISTQSNQKNFLHLTRYLHGIFTTAYETISSAPSEYLVSNLYSRTNWRNFFDKKKITGQEIDSYGKVRVLQLDGKITITIPPAQPFNLPRISEYFKTPENEVIKMFGEPESYDADGFWYPWLDFSNAIYVFVEHDRSLAKENVTDQPSILTGTINLSDSLKTRLRYQKSCNALVQLIHWGWKLDHRTNIKAWWRSCVMKSNRYDQNTILPERIKITLPEKVKNSVEAFRWVSEWWPQAFDSYSGKISVYPELYDKLYKFFLREAEVMEDYDQDPVPPILFKIYENSGDYPEIANRVIFTSTRTFDDWVNNKKSPSLNFFDKIPRDMAIFTNFTPFKLFHWGRMMMIQNVASGTYDDALYVAAYWAIHHINLGWYASSSRPKADTIEINLDSESMMVTVYAISKILTLVPYEQNIPKRVTDLKVYIVIAPNGRYSALLL
jgi:hypothetical protein